MEEESLSHLHLHLDPDPMEAIDNLKKAGLEFGLGVSHWFRTANIAATGSVRHAGR